MRDDTLIRHEISIAPRRITRVLLVTALLLLACHGLLTIYHYEVGKLPWLLRQLFDVDQEDALPTWFSTILLLIASLSLWLCATIKQAKSEPWVLHWRLLSVGFLVLSIDEVAGFHETLNSLLPVHWTTWAAPLVLLILLGLLPFLLQLPRRTAGLFVLSGAIYAGGAMGLELMGEPLNVFTLAYNLLTLLEEGMEMLGVILFVHTLLGYLANTQTPGAGQSAVPRTGARNLGTRD